MRFEDVELIRKHMQTLVGAQWVDVGRAAAMAWFIFSRQGTQYSLHVQTAFRIRTEDTVLNANLDMFEPPPQIAECPSFDWDSFDWDMQGANCYDKWCQGFKDKALNGSVGVVRKIQVNDFGDLTIQNDNGLIIEVFINASRDECWRFFNNGSDYHLVVTGTGLDHEEE